MKHNRKNSLLAAITLTLTVPAAQATDYYWDIVNIGDGTPGPGDGTITGGGGFNWGTGNTRWTIDGGLNNLKWGNTLSDIAVFTDVGGTIGVNEVNAGGITFNNPSATGYTLTPNNILHLGGGGVIQTLATDGSHVNTITTKMQLMGTTATFSSNSANSTMEIGSYTSAWMTLGTGVTSATLTLNGTNTGKNVFGAANTGSTSIINNAAIAIVKDGPGTWWLSGKLQFTGGLTIKEGTLVFSHRDDAVGTTGITLGNSAGGANAATLVSGDTGRNVSRPITLAGTTTGTLTIAGGSGLAATTYSGGVTGNNNLTLDSRGTLLTMSGAAINHAGKLTVMGVGNTVISSGIASSVTDLAKNDAGTLTLSAANDYSGATAISGGTLEIGGAGQLGGGDYANVISVASGAKFTYNSSADQTISGAITNAGSVIKDGAVTLWLSAANAYGGGTIVSDGTLVASSSNALGSGPGGIVGGILRLTNSPSILGANTDVDLSGGTLDPAFTGTNQVHGLSTNGTALANGIYGSDTLGGYVTGGGYLQAGSTVVPPTPAFLPGGGVGMSDSGATLAFEGVSNWNYRIVYKDDLLNTNVWTALVPPGWLTATSNGTMQINDPTSTNIPMRFYRIEIQ